MVSAAWGGPFLVVCFIRSTARRGSSWRQALTALFSRASALWLWYPAPMRWAIWIGIFIGSTIGGFIPALWGDDLFSYSGVLLSGVGAFVGLWLGSRASQ
jgi:hypothetical protein